MTKQEMTRKLELYPGIGLETVWYDGHVVYYFYEDFAEDDLGLTRARKHMMDSPHIIKAVAIFADGTTATIKGDEENAK